MSPLEYEKFVQSVVQEICRELGNHVYHQKAYVGKKTEREIKIDISFDYTIMGGAHMPVLMECKNYKRRVSVGNVEEFHSKIDDIGAHKGIMVTTVGYQCGAIKAAKGRGIALALLRRERQENEISYVVKRNSPSSSENLLQGNIKLWENHRRESFSVFDDILNVRRDGETGYRFESFSDLLKIWGGSWKRG